MKISTSCARLFGSMALAVMAVVLPNAAGAAVYSNDLASALGGNVPTAGGTVILVQRGGGGRGSSAGRGGGGRAIGGGGANRMMRGPSGGNSGFSNKSFRSAPSIRSRSVTRTGPVSGNRVGTRRSVVVRRGVRSAGWGPRGRRYRRGARWYFWAPWVGSYVYFSNYNACYNSCRARGYSTGYCEDLCSW